MRLDIVYMDFDPGSKVAPAYTVHIDGQSVTCDLTAAQDPVTGVMTFAIDVPDLATYDRDKAFVVARNMSHVLGKGVIASVHVQPASEETDEGGCYTEADGSCTSPGPCVHSPRVEVTE